MSAKIDARQLRLIEEAMPYADICAKTVTKELNYIVTYQQAISIAHYHLVDQVRLYKDKDDLLYFKGLRLRLVSLIREDIYYETFEQKRDSSASAQEGKRVFKKVEHIHIDALDENEFAYEDMSLEQILERSEQKEIIKIAFSAIDKDEQLLIFKIYYLGEPLGDIAENMGLKRNQSILLVRRRNIALAKMKVKLIDTNSVK